ncbi:protein delta homolog 2-like isoform X2 [Lethenteron reissneri]|uniref:protein delta homolog 2-like isoform X2 n=1 Tax=Lethenteron reissneri TaxID=7753 RepID=UPI002AB61514|nr:protein delta homolog 2-like isoform X2 [Lethenteron reissneri]
MAFVRTRWALIFLLLYLSWREASPQPCGGVLTERRGEVASPGYPQPGYPNRVRCTWEIRAGGRDTVRIRMRSMRIEDDPTCRWDFLEVRFTGREPTRLCGSDMSRVPNGGVMQGRGETVIYLQSDDSVNDAGFLLNYEVIPPPCDSQPCQRGARCVEISQDDFRCNCPRGYTGKVCEIDIDECSPNPCQNGGRCIDGSASYTCDCAQGFTGTRCETDIDECISDPCQNGGQCVNGAGSFTCNCLAGYTGTLCDSDIDECSSGPCQNGGQCVNGADSFTCNCLAGYTGTLCDLDVDECASSPCLNGARCRDGVAVFTCECAPGFTGTRCETDVNECASSPCLNGARCRDGVAEFTCECAPGFTGTRCETAAPRDPCQPNPCANGRCEGQQGETFRCVCLPGFTGRLCESPVAPPTAPPPPPAQPPPPPPTSPPRRDDLYDQLGSVVPNSGAEVGEGRGSLAEGPLAAVVLGSLGVAALLGVILAFRLGGRTRPASGVVPPADPDRPAASRHCRRAPVTQATPATSVTRSRTGGSRPRSAAPGKGYCAETAQLCIQYG